nr:MAG TPA: hypothetical protein [Caudoviricetes sp.]
MRIFLKTALWWGQCAGKIENFFKALLFLNWLLRGVVGM